MKGFHSNIEQDTINNTDFRRVVYTGKHSQLVYMSLRPREEIGLETHNENDQFLRFEGGEGKCYIDDNVYDVSDGFAIIVPAGARHNVRNTGNQPLKLYTIYGPPEHKDGIVQATKDDADARHQDEEWDGKTTE